MIPNASINTNLDINFEIEKQPSKTYKLNLDTLQIGGLVDGIDAVKQVIFMILNTERYSYLIYDWDYGVEFNDLIGQPLPFVYPEIKRRITEALTQDDRILNVENFEFKKDKRNLSVRFNVNTIFGKIEAAKEVSV